MTKRGALFSWAELSEVASVRRAQRGTGISLNEMFRVSTDTREDLTDAVFVPLKGERFDGEEFLTKAHQAGACVLVHTRPLPSELMAASETLSFIEVPDGLAYLLDLAHAWSARLTPERIAVTGSVGKTSCRRWLETGLSYFSCVDGTKKNLNNPIGVAQTILGLAPDDCDIAVLELGMDRAGEIAASARALMPKHGVITNIGCSHLAHFKDRNGILRAKFEMLDYLQEGGTIHLLWDRDLLSQWTLEQIQREDLSHDMALFAIGQDFPEDAPPNLPMTLADYEPGTGSLLIRHFAQGQLQKSIEIRQDEAPLPAPHHKGHLAVLAQMLENYGELTREAMIYSLEHFTNEPGRNTRHEIRGITFIDDAYNASPESMGAAFNELRYRGVSRAIACLGPVNELGSDAPKLHAAIGREAVRAGIFRSLIFLEAPNAEFMVEGAHEAIRELGLAGEGAPTIALVSDLDALEAAVEEEARAGDTVLLKASNSYKLSSLIGRFEMA